MVARYWMLIGMVGLVGSGATGESRAEEPVPVELPAVVSPEVPARVSPEVPASVPAAEHATVPGSPDESTPPLAPMTDPQEPSIEQSLGTIPDRSVDMLNVERLRLEQLVQQAAIKLESALIEIQRVDQLQLLRLGKTLTPNHPRMKRLQLAQENSRQAITALQDAVMNIVDSQQYERKMQDHLQSRLQEWQRDYEHRKDPGSDSLEWSTDPQGKVIDERMRKMQEYLLQTNLEAISKARANAEAAAAAKLLEEERIKAMIARVEASLAQKQPADASASPPVGTTQQPSKLTETASTVDSRPLLLPRAGVPSDKEWEQLLMQKMSAQPARSANIEKRLEQLEGRLERIETLLQRLVPEPPPKRD